MDIGETLQVSSRDEWRAWLADHHQEKPEIWLVIIKSSAGKQAFSLPQAQEEALCFGWVDSMMKSMDAARYALRFTPRRKKSSWTDGNKALALQLLREGKVAPAGIASLPPEVLRAWEEESSPQ